jgi:membrane protease YdiL (CAAX protease family)
MKVATKIVGYALGVVLAGALLAPPLWYAGQWLVDTQLVPQLAEFRFAKYFNRAVLVVALGSLWPFLRWLGVRRWTDLELDPNPRRFGDLGLGLAVAVTGVFIVGASILAFDLGELRPTIPWHRVAGAFVTAAVVPLIEEPFFRGALLGMLRKALSWQRALLFLSIFFAVVHFLKPEPGSPRITDVHWDSGLALVPALFWQFGDPGRVALGWATLFLVGWVLGYTVIRTRSLYMAIGLHAGWVLALRSFYFMTRRPKGPTIWVGHELTEGILPLLMLAGSFAVVVWLLRGRRVPEA